MATASPRRAKKAFVSPRRRAGVVMVIALFALVLLAALVFYVFNTGRHLTQRIETQNAADNAALSGAGWVARSFNTVAMNNVEMARLIALANVLDAMPQAIEYTLADQNAVLEAIDAQLARGVGVDAWLADGLGEARDTITRQIELLQPMDELFNSGDYDVAAMTHYRGTGDARGDLWEAFESLSALSQATMENVGLLAHYNAHRGAQIAQRESGFSSGGLLLPWVMEVPWEMGAFDDLRSPVIDGVLPDDQDDQEVNRGPFDTLFGFWRIRSSAEREDLGVAIERDYSLGGWAPQPPNQRITAREAQTYSTWGTYTDMRRSAMDMGVNPDTGVSSRYIEALSDPADAERHPLVPSLWARRVGLISDQKINYLYPGSASNNVVREPVWITDYEGALVILEDQSSLQIAYGLYLVFTYVGDEYEGEFPPDPTLESWGLVRPESNVLNPPGLERVTENIWRDERVEGYTDASGRRFTRRYRRYYVFVGVNIGAEATVRNPNNFDEEDRNELPGPINFTAGEFPPDESVRRENLMFLGIAYQPKEASFWPSGFDGNRPDKNMVGLAQAEVFNNHSWDLWTQMWQAELTLIEGFDNTPLAGGASWMEQLEDPQGTAEMPWLDEDEAAAVAEYLRATAPLSDLMLKH